MANNESEHSVTTVQRSRDDQFRDVYSNQVFVGISPFDISLTFSKNTEVAPDTRGLLDLVCVTLSPQQFKAMAKTIANSIEAYEESFGALSINDDVIEPTLAKEHISQLLNQAKKSQVSARKKVRADIKR